MAQTLIRCRIQAAAVLHPDQYVDHLIDVAGPVVGIKPPPPWRSIRGIMLTGPLAGKSVEIAKAIVRVEPAQGDSAPAGPVPAKPDAPSTDDIFSPRLTPKEPEE